MKSDPGLIDVLFPLLIFGLGFWLGRATRTRDLYRNRSSQKGRVE